ncbi:putative fad binding domain protein [Rosellinia necatrix]|uniref:Putative fad binding domain protein n=1 Tax=Rosellinia necatrix TaxID=77044 RepID=A0A1S8A903_ROSNE|nr:putative fad binding domain protein [Rosellinia necatrix]
MDQRRRDSHEEGEGIRPPPPPPSQTPAPPHILIREAADPAAFAEAVWGRVFNRRRDGARVPRAVARASSAAEVRAAAALAARLGCRVSVRSGGHSWAAWSVRHDAVLVDLGALRHLAWEDDNGGGVVACSPSTTGEELNAFLATRGRMFAGGHCPDVGLGGFLLQGGMGWNCKVRKEKERETCLAQRMPWNYMTISLTSLCHVELGLGLRVDRWHRRRDGGC